MRVKRRRINGQLTRVYYAWIPKLGGGTRLVSTNCTDRKAAESKAAELERSAVDPSYAAAEAYTTEQLLGAYVLDRKRRKRAAETVAFTLKKAGHLRRLLPSSTPLYSHAVLLAYVDARQGEGSANTTILKELRVLGGAWKLARKSKLVSQPWDELNPGLDDDHEDRTRWLTPWEIYALALVLPRRRAAQLAFACATGCDPGALPRVRRGDVAADCSRVHIRGTKRKTRDRIVPVTLPLQRALLAWAMTHADGGLEDRLFSAWPNLRNDVVKACERVGIPRCSPNDWRRTFGTWLRVLGVEPNVIGSAMGHIDGRMVERVYGRLPPDALARLLGEATKRVRLMSGDMVETGGRGMHAETSEAMILAGIVVPRDGIEPPTRGFSIPPDVPGKEGKARDSAPTCPANVRYIRAVAWGWFARGAA